MDSPLRPQVYQYKKKCINVDQTTGFEIQGAWFEFRSIFWTSGLLEELRSNERRHVTYRAAVVRV